MPEPLYFPIFDCQSIQHLIGVVKTFCADLFIGFSSCYSCLLLAHRASSFRLLVHTRISCTESFLDSGILLDEVLLPNGDNQHWIFSSKHIVGVSRLRVHVRQIG
jgi:hypothetical protein